MHIDGKRHRIDALTESEAARKLGALLHGDQRQRDQDRKATLGALLDEWQAKALPNKKLAPATHEAHAWGCALWVKELGSTRVATLTTEQVESALGRMARSGLGKASLIKCRSTLRQALEWAERRRTVAYNVAATAELPTATTTTRARRALTQKELDRLLTELRGHRWEGAFVLMARCALRPGEAFGVCADALLLNKNPTVAVVRSVQLRHGKPFLVDDLKTSRSRRTLAIPPDVAAMLAGLLAASNPSKSHASDLLFTASDGGPVWPSVARTELTEACERAKVPTVTPNELRHSCATLAAEYVPLHLLADAMGHVDGRMLAATYRHRPNVVGTEFR